MERLFTTKNRWPIALFIWTLLGCELSAIQAAAPSYRIERYEAIGSAVLEQATINHWMRPAIGTNVAVAQIRQSLLRLQDAYREAGLKKATLTLRQQPLTNGVAFIQVAENSSAANSTTAAGNELEAWAAPSYAVRHFEIRGNTTLSAEEIDRVLSPAAGEAASLKQLQAALAQLQAAYSAHGFKNASVTLPQQLLTDGVVVIQVDEGRTPEAEAKALAERFAPAKPAEPAPPARTFEVSRYEVAGNTLLKSELIDGILDKGTGTNITIAQIQKAVGELQLAYRERGYATVQVGLPPQQITNATVRVQVTEGHLVEARVTGTRYFSSNNVMRALPSLKENLATQGEVLNSRVFQRELDIANQNRDRQVYPTLSPGPEPGTTALELRVKDRLPLHGRVEVNNQGTPGTPEWRVNANANYGNLWQLEHQFGVSYGFTPEKYKDGDLDPDYFLNRPLIANYGAFYRMPFGTPQSLSQRINNSTAFGYDEATRQYRLPPAGATPDLTVFGSVSSSDTGVKFGEPSTYYQTNNQTLLSQDTGRNLTANESAGARASVPWNLTDTKRFSFSGGLDTKRYLLESFNTNNFTFITIFTNPSQGSITIVDKKAVAQTPRRVEVNYLPLALGADFFESDPRGSFSASLGLGQNFVGSQSDFSAAAYSTNANANYTKATLALTRDQKLFGDWTLFSRFNGQIASGPLISNEQFALGGVNSLRGYYEGDEYGDSGWTGSVELRTPYLNQSVAAFLDATPVWLRGIVFVEGGQRFLLDGDATNTPTTSLLSTGFGISANINNRLDMRIQVGFPLRDSANTRSGEPRVHFSLGGQF